MGGMETSVRVVDIQKETEIELDIRGRVNRRKEKRKERGMLLYEYEK